MNPNPRAFIGLDVGSTSVKCVIGVEDTQAKKVRIVGVGKSTTTGMRKGVVVDLEDVAESIAETIDKAERMSGYRVNSATVSVDGAHIVSINSKGVIAVGGSDKEIDDSDIDRVIDAATVVQLPPNREIVDVYARNFVLDGQDNIKDPHGMTGLRLEGEAHIVTASTPALKNLEKTIQATEVDINNKVVAGIASAHAVLNKREKEIGVVVLDIGGSTTGVAVYEEGELMHTATVPVGSAHITNDLAIGLQTDIDTAEEIKLSYGPVSASKSSYKKIKEHKSGEMKEFDLEKVSMIIESRLEELFELVDDELKKVERDQKLPAGAVLTGGGAELNNIEEHAKAFLKLPAHVSRPSGLSGLTEKVSNGSYSTAVGLMILDKHEPKFHPSNIGIGGMMKSLKKAFGWLKP